MVCIDATSRTILDDLPQIHCVRRAEQLGDCIDGYHRRLGRVFSVHSPCLEVRISRHLAPYGKDNARACNCGASVDVPGPYSLRRGPTFVSRIDQETIRHSHSTELCPFRWYRRSFIMMVPIHIASHALTLPSLCWSWVWGRRAFQHTGTGHWLSYGYKHSDREAL